MLHHIGTDGGTKAWSNPHTDGKVVAAISSVANGDAVTYSQPLKLVGRSDDGYCFTGREPNSWMSVDLGEGRTVVPTHYCLRHDRTGDYALRDWTLEGKTGEPGADWVQIRRHDGDTQTLASHEWPHSYGWRDFRVELTGGTLRLWLNGENEPTLTADDEKPIEGKGHAGIRAWGGAVRTDNLKLHLAKRTVLIDEINPAKSADGELVTHPRLGLAKRRALKDLCSVMFILRVFVYLD